MDNKRMLIFFCLSRQRWRPGAISKRLLRKLNKAKETKSAVKLNKRQRKAKKRVEAKPALIISKIRGEYRIEMQVKPGNSEEIGGNQQCDPLIYKIAKANNEDRVKRMEKKKQRIIREAIGDWVDPYHPEVCETTCLKAYQQAMGILPYDPNNFECTCDDKVNTEMVESCSCDDEDDTDLSSDCSSLDVDWEIHFTPPFQP